MPDAKKNTGSFRDPSGFIFSIGETIFRQVNNNYQEDFDYLNSSGLYEKLLKKKYLIPHEETDQAAPQPDIAYKVIRPEKIGFISYPYEWSFSQLKDAALLTLKIQVLALKHGMSLKDSSAYNIQFHPHTGRPILIDSLSFERYKEGLPWTAYRQYCQHFLAPLALMTHTDVRLSQLLRVYIDGIPLDLAANTLPKKTKFNSGLATHIHLHAASQQRYADKTVEKESISRQMSKTAFLGLIDSLKRTTAKLTWSPEGTEWGEYYEDTNYTEQSHEHKQSLVKEFLEIAMPKRVWDMGANTGVFSRIASQKDIETIAFDIDPSAVEKNYLQIKSQKEKNHTPLLLDLTNPSPSGGWQNQERQSLIERGPTDLVMALALIHHLAISNNVPLDLIAEQFSQLSPWLIIEFIPKEDSQVNRLLATREDIFPNYTIEGFEQTFSKLYRINSKEHIKDSKRWLYLLEKK